MWGSGGSVEGGDVEEVKVAVEKFFLSDSASGEQKGKCDVCLKEGGEGGITALSEALSEELVGVVLHVLLVPQGERGRCLCLCDECTASLTSLADLYFHLDDLRREFNDLRRRVGKAVIVGSLGRSAEEWEGWKKEVRQVEDLFPSCVGVKGVSRFCTEEEEEEESVGAPNIKQEQVMEETMEPQSSVVDGEELGLEENDPKLTKVMEEEIEERVEEEEECVEDAVEKNSVMELQLPHVESEDLTLEEDDPKLKKMKPVVVCERLKEKSGTAPPSEVTDLDIEDIRSTADSSTDDEDGSVTRNGPLNIKKEIENEDFEICAQRTFACPLCDKTYLRKDNLKRHVQSFHFKQPRQLPSCPKCNVTFRTKTLALRHFNKEHKERTSRTHSKSVKSRFNSKSLGSPSRLLRHRKTTNTPVTLPSSVLQCPSCPQLFPTEALLQQHRINTHGYVPRGSDKYRRQCDICFKVFGRTDCLKKHLRTMHGVIRGTTKILCTHCDVSFGNIYNFRRHQLTTHFLRSSEEGDAQCSLCLQLFDTPRRLEVHQMEVHFEGRQRVQKRQRAAKEAQGRVSLNIRCVFCGTTSPSFSSAAELKAHEESDAHRAKILSKVSVHCNVCRLNLKGDTKALEIHLQSPQHQKEVDSLGNFNPRTFCVPCRLHFSNFANLRTHIGGFTHERSVAQFRDNQMGELPAGDSLKCQSCQKAFDFEAALDRHVLTHHDPQGYDCQFCEMKFAHLRDFQSHRLTHKDEIPKDVVCDKCGKSFEHLKNLTRHNLMVHNGEVSKCEKCGKSFPTQMSLEKHMKRAHLPGAWKKVLYSSNCPHCGVTFKKPHALRKHRFRSHRKEYTKEFPHPCLTCFHVFSTKKELATHKKLHPHLKCPMCGKKFKSRKELNEHVEIHEEEERLKCGKCGKQFQTENALKKHLTTHSEK